MPTRLIAPGERRRLQKRFVAINAILQFLLPLDAVLLKLALLLILIIIYYSIPRYPQESASEIVALLSDEE